MFQTKIYEFHNKHNQSKYGLWNQTIIIPNHLQEQIEFVSGLGFVQPKNMSNIIKIYLK